MALQRWEPLTEMDQMRRRMEKMFDQFLGQRLQGLPSMGMMPSVEMYETDKDLILNVELPGIDPKNVTVEISEDSIFLSGETKQESEIQEDTYYHSERMFGEFKRTIPLPNRIKDQEAKATFKNGLLTIRAPLAVQQKRSRPHKISIES